MAKRRRVLTCDPEAVRALLGLDVRPANAPSLGKVVRRKGTKVAGERWCIDLGSRWPPRLLHSFLGTPLSSEALAQAVLGHIEARVAGGAKLDDVMGTLAPRQSTNALIDPLLKRWIEIFRKRVEQGNRQPNTLLEYERWSGPAGGKASHFEYWYGKTIFDVDRAKLEEWSFWLTERGLSQKSAKNVMGAFHAFLRWVADDVRTDYKLPKFPWPQPDEHVPNTISWELQTKIIEAIPEEKQGIFWAMAECLVRPGEARVLRVRDWQGWDLVVARAAKTKRLGGLVRGLKARNAKKVPIQAWSLGDWLHRHVSNERRLKDPDGPLFVNPDGEGGWFVDTTMRRIWKKACAQVGVSGVNMYEGTKHSSATHLKAQGADDRLLAKLMGHRDLKSVEKYARLDAEAIRSGIDRLRRK